MKSLAILLVTVAAASALQVSAPVSASFGAGTPGAAAGVGVGQPGAAAGGAAANPGFVDYGPKVYGMGAKNPLALPPNPFVIQRALAVANSVPNVLVRLDLNGEITLTNQFGQEVDVVDAFGREIEYEF
ncbi:uncharacterized protein LOC126983766 [Eriocheir sinensis]|uniref:uncharacterized protein LOC126983766 n=1 Tax=Eriocheir sinensis TaxID=95602 RepID=UPI0021C603D3|nr:uncharacterized protein LOC126983766 [Eriocheir sinensis]